MEFRVERSARKSLSMEVVEGGVVVKAPYWVELEYIQAFVQRYRHWIEQRQRQYQEEQRCYFLLGRRYERNNQDVAQLWRDTMHQIVLPRAWELAKRYGDEPRAIKISWAKKRWGSCSSKKVINLSYRLAQLPLFLIDYVIIHELCHLTYMDHSRAFWKLVAKRCPDYQYCEDALKHF